MAGRTKEQDVATKLTRVAFGNDNPQMQVRVGDDHVSVPAEHISSSVTEVSMWDGFDDPALVELTLSTSNDRILSLIARGLSDADRKYAIGIGELEQIVAVHSGGGKPTWVASSDPDFAEALAKHFECAIGEEPVALLTNNGRDAIHSQMLNTSAQPAAFNYMALANSSTATSPNATDTTLTGEITTAGGGLVRAQGTYAHTTGTNTTTITKTFTANGSDSLPVTVSQDALFNASSSGTMGWKTALNSNATLNVSGDNVTVTHTITAG